jgi:hypothetical protein
MISVDGSEDSAYRIPLDADEGHVKNRCCHLRILHSNKSPIGSGRTNVVNVDMFAVNVSVKGDSTLTSRSERTEALSKCL